MASGNHNGGQGCEVMMVAEHTPTKPFFSDICMHIYIYSYATCVLCTIVWYIYIYRTRCFSILPVWLNAHFYTSRFWIGSHSAPLSHTCSLDCKENHQKSKWATIRIQTKTWKQALLMWCFIYNIYDECRGEWCGDTRYCRRYRSKWAIRKMLIS